ncbi:MAG: hypothetical protein ACI9G1_003893 [Pirellulaceae bacterium]|jgi:hypothetical protein
MLGPDSLFSRVGLEYAHCGGVFRRQFLNFNAGE